MITIILNDELLNTSFLKEDRLQKTESLLHAAIVRTGLFMPEINETFLNKDPRIAPAIEHVPYIAIGFDESIFSNIGNPVRAVDDLTLTDALWIKYASSIIKRMSFCELSSTNHARILMTMQDKMKNEIRSLLPAVAEFTYGIYVNNDCIHAHEKSREMYVKQGINVLQNYLFGNIIMAVSDYLPRLNKTKEFNNSALTVDMMELSEYLNKKGNGGNSTPTQ